MIKAIYLGGAAAAALLASNAQATVFNLFLTDANATTFSFSVDTANGSTGKALQTNFSNVAISVNGGSSVLSALQFTASGSLGADQFVFLPNTGQSFFSGAGTSLVLQTGTFTGFDGPAGVTASLKITSDAVAPVPEPATWAMMVGGFGLLGAAMRRRRPVTAVTFA